MSSEIMSRYPCWPSAESRVSNDDACSPVLLVDICFVFHNNEKCLRHLSACPTAYDSDPCWRLLKHAQSQHHVAQALPGACAC